LKTVSVRVYKNDTLLLSQIVSLTLITLQLLGAT